MTDTINNCESPDTYAGFPLVGSAIFVNEEGEPFFDSDLRLYIHTAMCEPIISERLHPNERNVYALDFFTKDPRLTLELDREFFFLGRIQGVRISPKPGDIRMAINVMSWSYDHRDITKFYADEIRQAIHLLTCSIPILSPRIDKPKVFPGAEAFTPKQSFPESDAFDPEPEDKPIPQPPDDDIPFEGGLASAGTESADEPPDWAMDIDYRE